MVKWAATTISKEVKGEGCMVEMCNPYFPVCAMYIGP